RPSASLAPPGRARERVTWTRSATVLLGASMELKLATHRLRPKLEFTGLGPDRVALVDLGERHGDRVRECVHVLLGAELARHRGRPAGLDAARGDPLALPQRVCAIAC